MILDMLQPVLYASRMMNEGKTLRCDFCGCDIDEEGRPVVQLRSDIFCSVRCSKDADTEYRREMQEAYDHEWGH